MLHRRDVCAGLAASLAAGSAAAAKGLFPSGPLAGTLPAVTFEVPSPPLTLPAVPLIGEHGPESLAALRGRTWLVSLWAEWCAPCLAEARDLAALGEAYGGKTFGLIFVLTGSHKKLDFAGARALLARYGAGGARLLVEPDGGKAAMDALAAHEMDEATKAAILARLPAEKRAGIRFGGVALPCNLVVDRQGRVRGRSFGSGSAVPTSTPRSGPLSEADKLKVLDTPTVWSTPPGRDFVAALASGALDRN